MPVRISRRASRSSGNSDQEHDQDKHDQGPDLHHDDSAMYSKSFCRDKALRQKRPKSEQRGGKDILSATAYAGFIASPFQAWMDKLSLECPDDSRCAAMKDGVEKSLASRGVLIEDKLLKWFNRRPSRWSLKDLSGVVSKIRADASGKGLQGIERYQACADQTLQTLEGLKTPGAKVLYQAPVYDSCLGFFGIVDFLIQNKEGDFAIWDTKLATHPSAYHIAQLVGYAVALESMLGSKGKVKKVGLVLGEQAAEHGAISEVSVSGLRSYFRESWWAFQKFHNTFDPNHPPDPAEEPKANLGRWAPAAEKLFSLKDDPALIASMTRSQRAALKVAGYDSMTSIAQLPSNTDGVAKVAAVTGIKSKTLERLHLQASLQCQTRDMDSETPASQLLPDAAHVLAALPADDPGDVFIDFESLPWNKPPAACEYLIGLSTRDGTYHDWWSHTHDDEQQNTRQVLDFFVDRLERFPKMHAYCYGHYERSAFLRLAVGLPQKYQELVEYFVNSILVDLYPIVKGSLVLGLPGYGLKQVEKMFRKLAELQSLIKVAALQVWVRS